MIEPTNRDRAKRLCRTLKFIENYGHDSNVLELSAYVSDLLVDIRHLCDRRGMAFHQLDQDGYRDYLIEVGEDKQNDNIQN